MSTTARWAVLVVLGFAAIHGPYLAQRYEPNTWLFADGSFYFKTVQSLADHGRLEQRDYHPASWYEQNLGWNDSLDDAWSDVALGRSGDWYPKHPILLPLAAVPFYFMFGVQGTLVTNVGLNLIFILLVFLLARRVAHPGVAAAVALAVATVPFVKSMSYTFSNDLLGAVLILGAMEAVLGDSFGWAGICAGLALWSRVTNASFLPALVLIGHGQGGWKGVRRAILFALVPLVPYAALNTWQFGAPWIISYQRVLVRERGQLQIASHARMFTIPWVKGFHRVVMSGEGGFENFPLLAPGLVGLLTLWRRWPRLIIAVLLCAVLPALTFMKYVCYRPHFLYPAYGLSAIGLAAGLQTLLFFLPRPGVIAPAPWSFASKAIAAGLGLALFFDLTLRHRSQHPDRALLSTYVPAAKVFSGNVPCDYWNPQNERWECSHDDPEAWAETGLTLREAVPVKGAKHTGIWMHPNPTRKWRRLVFESLDAQSVDLDLALGDQTTKGQVAIELRPRGGDPVALAMEGGGSEEKRHLIIAPGPGPALEIRTRAEDPHWKHLVIEGRLLATP